MEEDARQREEKRLRDDLQQVPWYEDQNPDGSLRQAAEMRLADLANHQAREDCDREGGLTFFDERRLEAAAKDHALAACAPYQPAREGELVRAKVWYRSIYLTYYRKYALEHFQKMAIADQLRRESEQWRTTHELIGLQVSKTARGWQMEIDQAAWSGLVSALTQAIANEEQEGRAQGEEAQRWRALRKALQGGTAGNVGPIF